MKKVVFLCVENSCRSQIAEAFANIHGKDVILAFSAGSKPSGAVNPKAVSLMKEINYDLSKHQSIHVDKLPDVEICLLYTSDAADE